MGYIYQWSSLISIGHNSRISASCTKKRRKTEKRAAFKIPGIDSRAIKESSQGDNNVAEKLG